MPLPSRHHITGQLFAHSFKNSCETIVLGWVVVIVFDDKMCECFSSGYSNLKCNNFLIPDNLKQKQTSDNYKFTSCGFQHWKDVPQEVYGRQL